MIDDGFLIECYTNTNTIHLSFIIYHPSDVNIRHFVNLGILDALAIILHPDMNSDEKSISLALTVFKAILETEMLVLTLDNGWWMMDDGWSIVDEEVINRYLFFLL